MIRLITFNRNNGLLTASLSLLLALASSVAWAQIPAFDPLAPGAARPDMPRPAQPKPGQPKPAQPKPTQRPQTPAAPKEEVKEELKPRLEKVTAKDGMKLQIGYFPSDRGKKAAPVLLIHEWSGQSSPYIPLAQALQSQGVAVALLDIRGHGRSKLPDNDRSSRSRNDSPTKQKLEVVAKFDLEAANKFLKRENDAGKLNLNALTVIGIEEGAILAMNWTVMDWSWPTLGNKKQGQDVKAMVLISPVRTVAGIHGEIALRHPVVSRLPVMILSGSTPKENSEAARLKGMFEKARLPGRFDDTVPLPVAAIRVRAKLSGAGLVRGTKGLAERITKFVVENVANKQDDFEWISRSE